MYYLLLGGGVILGYNYSDNIKEWGLKQNKYISNYFTKKDFIFNLIKIEKIMYYGKDNIKVANSIVPITLSFIYPP